MKYLFVARWKEDTGWTEQLPEEWNVGIFQKGTPQLPNIGREPDTFLYVLSNICGLKDTGDEDVYVFVQGWPFDHSPNLLKKLEEPITGFTWLSESMHVTDGNGSPAHTGLPVAQKYEQWLGRKWPGNVPFYAGGQFAITGKEVKKYSPEKYLELKKEMSEGQNAWIMERLWEELFK